MTEYVLALIPDYGLFVVFGVVCIACLGIPLPSSIVLLTSGAFAAAGDLQIWQVILAAVAAYCLGDQIAFNSARLFGPNILEFLSKNEKLSALVKRSEALLDKHGLLGIFLSRTVFSPVGPFVGYVSGAVQMNWKSFSMAAIPAAALWCSCYTLLGYVFAVDLPQMSSLVVSILIFSVAFLAAIGFAIRIAFVWNKFEG